MSDCPMLISNKLHSFRNFKIQKYKNGTNRKAKFSYAAIGVLLLGLVSYDSKNSGLNN